jgi:hypothetical protein
MKETHAHGSFCKFDSTPPPLLSANLGKPLPVTQRADAGGGGIVQYQLLGTLTGRIL